MWLTEGCGGRRRTVATPNRESRKEKKKKLVMIFILHTLYRYLSFSFLK